MIITALVENTSKSELKAEHGLSLYIQTQQHKILFDLGSGDVLFENAAKRGIDLSEVDIVVISHGHIDHGGALRKFLEVNPKAKVYVHKKAFEPHYSKVLFFKVSIGLDRELATKPQIILTEGDYKIDEELALFTVKGLGKCHSPVNDVLCDENGRDDFAHEQNLVISENKVVVIMGCGHCGVVNIMEKAKVYHPQVCVGGFHLNNPITMKSVPFGLLDEIAQELQTFEKTQFYTCHCTGERAYQYLKKKLKNLSYLSCGESIEI